MISSRSFYTPDEEDEYQPPIHLHRPPTGHGPKTLPPRFVKQQNTYDDNGKMMDVGLPVIGASKGDLNAKKGWEFWKGLELSMEKKGEVVKEGSVLLSHGSRIPIQLPATRDRKRSATLTGPAAPSSVPLQVPRSQWFIRKALLAKSRSGTSSSSNDNSSSSSVTIPSLASLIDLPPPSTSSSSPAATIAFRPPAHYHLNEQSNVGYRILKSKGWDERGGLGRPEGWLESEGSGVDVGSEKGVEGSENYSDGISENLAAQIDAKSSVDMEGNREIQHTGSKKSIVDLTEDSDSEDDDSMNQATTSHHRILHPHSPSIAPGRTAPIPTRLKPDLHGIGHLTSTTHLRPSSSSLPSHLLAARKQADDIRRSKKRVTHSDADVRAMRRGKVLLDEGGLVGRREMKKRVERDREESKRWREAMM